MSLIDPDGMFGGDRMALLSDNARLHWPWFWCASNTVARLELDYQKVITRAYRQFTVKPSEDEFWALVGEFRKAYLLYIYERDGQIWGQWDTSEKYLQRHKLTADIRSPAPTVREFADFKNQYIEDKKLKASHKFSVLSNFGNFPKVREGSHTDVRGVGVGGGGVEGEEKSKPRTADAALVPTATADGGLVRSAVPTRRRGKRTTEEITTALGTERYGWWVKFWEIYPCHESMNPAMDAFERKAINREVTQQIMNGAKRYRDKCATELARDPAAKVKYGQGWLNDERWRDETVTPKPPIKPTVYFDDRYLTEAGE